MEEYKKNFKTILGKQLKNYRKGREEVEIEEGNYSLKLLELIHNRYLNWLEGIRITKLMKEHTQDRLTNCPESISEHIICLLLGFIRKDMIPSNYLSFLTKLYKGKKSWDCIDPKNNERIQCKFSSSLNDLTSFSPKMNAFDELYFMYLNVQTENYQIFKIDKEILENTKVNKNQVFKDQKTQGRRPRLSIRRCMIDKGLKPILEGKMNIFGD